MPALDGGERRRVRVLQTEMIKVRVYFPVVQRAATRCPHETTPRALQQKRLILIINFYLSPFNV